MLTVGNQQIELASQNFKPRVAAAINERDSTVLVPAALEYIRAESRKGSKVSDNTVSAYQRNLAEYLSFMWRSEFNLLRLDKFKAKSYVEYLEKSYAPSSLAQKLAPVRWFHEMLNDLELGQKHNIWRTVKSSNKSSSPENTIKFYSLTEISRMKDVADGETLTVIMLGVLAGMRVSEMAHYGVDGDMIVIQPGDSKSGKIRRIPLLPQLREYFETDYSPVTSNRHQLYNKLARVCHKAGVPFKGVHGLRHTCAMVLLEHSNYSLAVVQSFLDHSSLQMAQIYAQISKAQVKEVIQNMPRI